MSKSTAKKPVTSGVAKVPVIMQMEALECGAACLDMILAYYDIWVPLEKVRLDCGVSRDGSSAGMVVTAARHYGLVAEGFKVEPEDIVKEGEFPCIIHWNFNHFVVLKGIKGNKVYINDPGRGSIVVSMEEFDKAFTGVCLMFEPGENLVPSGHKKSMVAFVWRRIAGIKKLILLTAVVSLMVTVLNMFSTSMSRVYMDYILGGKNPHWITGFFVIYGAFILIEFIVTLTQSILALKIGGKLTLAGETSFVWKLMRLPMNFFGQRMAGDIMTRATSNASVGNTLMGVIAPQFFNTVMMIFYLVVMLRYSVIMTAVGLGAMAIQSVLTFIVSAKRVNITRVQARDSGKLSGTTVSGIQMMETIKSTGAERGFFKKWSGYQASANLGVFRIEKITSLLSVLVSFISSLANLVILGMGILLVIRGEFTLGMITGFQGFLNMFMTPALAMLDMGTTIQEMRTSMERIDDVMEYPDDPNYQGAEISEDGDVAKLSGNIEFKDVTFGYSPLGKPIIKNFNMTIKKGQSIALVGGSGCGKSTISKLISGLVHPWSGTITYDGKTIDQISREVFTGSIAVVDQDIVLFADTIANNIKMWDDTIMDFEMILSARDAQIHDDIISRPEGYSAMLTERGSNLSGGQRQRLEIARVLAQDPTVMIMDEATSALDARTEYNLICSVKERGLTSIVVAHRLSTIRDCDLILVLDKGQVVESGTHDELMKLGGLYTSLVTSE